MLTLNFLCIPPPHSSYCVGWAVPRLLTLWRFLHFSFMHFLDLRSRKALTVLAFIQNSSKNLHELLPPKKAQSQQPRQCPPLQVKADQGFELILQSIDFANTDRTHNSIVLGLGRSVLCSIADINVTRT
jgi:hypothetical protein